MIYRSIILLLLYFSCQITAFAYTIDEKTRELRNLQQRMQMLDRNLNNARDKRETLHTELHHIEVDINNHTLRLKRTNHQWQQENEQIMHLRAASELSKQQLIEQKND